MTPIPGSLKYLPFLIAGLCMVAGFAIDGLKSGILGALAGYFLAKAIQSTMWTFQGYRTT
jgi:hypothetical protein